MLAANVPVVNLWSLIHDQWRMGGFGPVAIDMQAVFLVAPVIGLAVTEDVLRKIRTLADDRLQQIEERKQE